MELKINRIENIVLNDLLNNNGEKFLDLNEFIINKFKIEKDEYHCWLDEQSIRIYETLDYNAVLDSWFGVQGFEGTVIANKDTFVIVPPIGYEYIYNNIKLEYSNDIEGLREAFFNNLLTNNIAYTKIKDKDVFICIDEI